jgi:hypothetical protein
MTKNCSMEAMYSSAKSLITIDESHLKATKRTNKALWILESYESSVS